VPPSPTGEPLRVAHFVQRYPPALGGSEAYFARLSRYLAQQGDDVVVFTTTALDLEAFWDRRGKQLAAGEEALDGVRVRRFRLWHLPLGHRYVLKALSLVPLPCWQALTVPFNPVALGMWRAPGRVEDRFDVVHAAAFPYSFPLACARRLARRLGVPFFLTPFVHTGDPDDPHDRIRRAYTTPALLGLARAADRVFVQTEGERSELLRHGLREDRITLQGLGVDLPGCTGGDRRRARRRWQVGEDEVVVGHLANNSVEKGSVDLLCAAERAWADGARFTLVLAGPEMPSFRAFWRSFAPRGRVVRCGALSDDEKRDFFAAIDVFALPSRSDSFGLVLPEAWANGVPCVGYRAGGVAWVIRDGRDGLLVRCGDVAALAEALGRLAADAQLRRGLGEAGRARLAAEFEWGSKLRLVRQAYLDAKRR
jgi:glycosyltransferase involved in cell wall biosynthesis